jgi:hypothetical protein
MNRSDEILKYAEGVGEFPPRVGFATLGTKRIAVL